MLDKHLILFTALLVIATWGLMTVFHPPADTMANGKKASITVPYKNYLNNAFYSPRNKTRFQACRIACYDANQAFIDSLSEAERASYNKRYAKIKALITNDNNHIPEFATVVARSKYPKRAIAISEREAAVRNTISKNGCDLGFFQINYSILEGLRNYDNTLPVVSSKDEFMARTDLQILYFDPIVTYLSTKFPDADLETQIRMYNVGEFNWQYSSRNYYEPILTRLKQLENIDV